MRSKTFLSVLSFTLHCTAVFSQQTNVSGNTLFAGRASSFKHVIHPENHATNVISSGNEFKFASVKINPGIKNQIDKGSFALAPSEKSFRLDEHKINLGLGAKNNEFFLNNRRNRYSALWAFTTLNYLYADLVGLMDKNILRQYQDGVVDGTKITPGFLTAAAGFMQIPISNVFLPQVIRNERTLKWVQIASGAVMTLVQSGTLFMGKPAPYYILFSAIEIGTTAYITIDALKWKPKKAERMD